MTDEHYDDVNRVLNLAFRGLEFISDVDLERIISFDMEWLSPEEAEVAVTKLIDAGWLKGDRESLEPCFKRSNTVTPVGWFPRPSRLLNPVKYQLQTSQVINQDGNEIYKTKKLDGQKTEHQLNTSSDPRNKLSTRLLKYIVKETKISSEEIKRRVERKRNSLRYATDWICLALIAREQKLPMEQIVTSLSC